MARFLAWKGGRVRDVGAASEEEKEREKWEREEKAERRKR
jgi:hypothetical protein